MGRSGCVLVATTFAILFTQCCCVHGNLYWKCYKYGHAGLWEPSQGIGTAQIWGWWSSLPPWRLCMQLNNNKNWQVCQPILGTYKVCMQTTMNIWQNILNEQMAVYTKCKSCMHKWQHILHANYEWTHGSVYWHADCEHKSVQVSKWQHMLTCSITPSLCRAAMVEAHAPPYNSTKHEIPHLFCLTAYQHLSI